MTTTTLTGSLYEAWRARANAAAQDLDRAASSPALFTPAFMAEREADLQNALIWMRYWQAQAVTS